MVRWTQLAAGVALAGLLAAVAGADQTTIPSAVGRVNVQGQGFCTGTLVTERLVVTAAHCLFNARTGQPVRLGDVHFVAGWDRGQFAAHAQPTAVYVDPAYDWRARNGPDGFANDVAFLELPAPLALPPLALSRVDAPPADVTLMHYSRRQPHLAAVSRNCRLREPLGRLWRLDCPVESGASGAPVLVEGPQGWQVVGIVIGRTESATRIGSLALPLGPDALP